MTTVYFGDLARSYVGLKNVGDILSVNAFRDVMIADWSSRGLVTPEYTYDYWTPENTKHYLSHICNLYGIRSKRLRRKGDVAYRIMAREVPGILRIEVNEEDEG